jgi:hypothetical protein
VLQKGGGTLESGSDGRTSYKCGFKVLLPLDTTAHEDNASIALEMTERMEQWLGDLEPQRNLDSIVDTTIYKNRSILMLGSTKPTQKAGGYAVTKVLRGANLEDVLRMPVDLATEQQSEWKAPYDVTDIDFCRRALTRLMPLPGAFTFNMAEDAELPVAGVGVRRPRLGASDDTAAVAREVTVKNPTMQAAVDAVPEIKAISALLDLALASAANKTVTWRSMRLLLEAGARHVTHKVKATPRKRKCTKKTKKSKKGYSARRHDSDGESDDDSEGDGEGNSADDSDGESYAKEFKYLFHVFGARSERYAEAYKGRYTVDDDWGDSGTWDGIKQGQTLDLYEVLGAVADKVLFWRG